MLGQGNVERPEVLLEPPALLRARDGRDVVALTTRNPSLVLAAGVMGTLLAAQRRASGGIQAPVLTHLTWSSLMLRYLPPLFRDRPARRGNVAAA